MACVSPFKLHLRLSSHIPKPSRQLPTFDLGPRDSFAKSRWFRRSQLQQKWLKFALADGEHVPARMRKSEKKGWGCSVARCTAEGMERELFVGRREGVFTAAERFKVVALVAAVMCLCNADRVVMSVAIVPLAAKHGWNSSFLGIVQIWRKRVMAWGVAFWSLATLLTPWAANHSTTSLLAVRAFFGLAEGVALPSMNNLLASFQLKKELLLLEYLWGDSSWEMWQDWSSLVMASTGISGPFVLFTSLGLLWFITWTFSVTSDPKECSSISKSELRLIQAGKSEPTVIKSKLPPLSSLFAELPTWAIIFANITNNWGYFVLLSWMPVYFKTVFNVNLKQAAWFSAVPWATVAISGYLAGAASDYLIRSGLFHNISKENHAVNWFCWSWSCIALLELREDANSCHIFDNRLKLELFQSSWLFTEYARISNSAGTLAAIISTIGTGFFVQWLGSFQAFLTLTACLYFATTIFWNLYATGERVF